LSAACRSESESQSFGVPSQRDASATVEDANPEMFLAALGDVAKARGMAQIAKAAGLGRESLYDALGAGAHPRYETVTAVLRALGVKFTIIADRPRAR
jgi:probable addiction module antidote protein